MKIDPKDQQRRQWFDDRPAERLGLITDIATRCYKEWDTWDIGPGPYGVQLAYLFATIANSPGGWTFALEMVNDDPDPLTVPLAQALLVVFHPDHAIWLYIDREWNGLPESSCPVCAHDCVGAYPIRHCYECSFDEAVHVIATYQPTQDEPTQ